MTKLSPFLFVSLALAFACAHGDLSAQVRPPEIAFSDATAFPPIRSETKLVDVYATVKRDGKYVVGLPSNAFVVSEDGVEQRITNFSMTSESALIALLIDISSSQTNVIAKQQEIAATVANGLFASSERGLVISFDSQVRLQTEVSGDTKVIRKAIGDALAVDRPGTLLDFNVAGSRTTALYDAITTASRRLQRHGGRKVMVLITDGEDIGSRAGIEDAIAAAHAADTMCFVILVADAGIASRPGYYGRLRMQRLTEETGGDMLIAKRDLGSLEELLARIAERLAAQYHLAYSPLRKEMSGEWRRIKVEVTGYSVEARKAYWAVPRP